MIPTLILGKWRSEMFYVGDVLWMEEQDSFEMIPTHLSYSGCVRYPNGATMWLKNGMFQSPQDPVTGKWLPAYVSYGNRYWYDKDEYHSFEDPVTGKLMPSIIWYDGGMQWTS